MNERASSRSLLLTRLELRENLGVYDGFGISGRLVKFALVRRDRQRAYNIGIRPDRGGENLHLTLTLGDLAAKGLSPASPAFALQSRVFVLHGDETDGARAFLLGDRGELRRFLDAVRDHLREVNDGVTYGLIEELTLSRKADRPLSDRFCHELSSLRRRSTAHIVPLLREPTHRRHVVEALDRGEILDFLDAYRHKTVAGANRLLSNRRMKFVCNVVRARYALRVRDRPLTTLGRKAFHQTPSAEFNARERDDMIRLVEHAVGSEPDAPADAP